MELYCHASATMGLVVVDVATHFVPDLTAESSTRCVRAGSQAVGACSIEPSPGVAGRRAPNDSIERTRNGMPRMALISF